MSVSAAYLSDLQYKADIPLVSHNYEAMQKEADVRALRKLALEALGAAVSQPFPQTSGNRWQGEDTLTRGDLGDWIQLKFVQYLVGSHTECIDVYLRETSALWEIVASARLSKLDEMYLLRNTTTVRRFLQTYPRLIDVLLEAQSHLAKHFGPDPQVALEVVSDPEADDAKQLFAYIRTSLPVEAALARLDMLDEEWFLDQLDRVNSLFNFNLEIV
jgi:hypothetical protein